MLVRHCPPPARHSGAGRLAYRSKRPRPSVARRQTRDDEIDHLVDGQLTAGQQVQDQFTVTSQDGTASGTVTVTITGTNDTATVSSDSKSVTEGDTAAALNASGQLTIVDPDTGQAHVVAQSNVPGTYGDFTIDANGAWSYTGNGAQAVDIDRSQFDLIAHRLAQPRCALRHRFGSCRLLRQFTKKSVVSHHPLQQISLPRESHSSDARYKRFTVS
ncbi:hypothetical protein DAB18_39400 [Bradyrhizobium sp. WBAH41]|nr:hypothetical protein DAB18_39400 [Bradyrhizobium sp. WBAH41]